MLTNLIFNAIKFTNAGSIKVSIHHEGLVDGKAYILASVADTGIGIPSDQLEKIFESFSQAHGDISLDSGGAGLGLAISSRLCQQMGGSLAVSSTVGEGSTFIANLVFEAVDLENNDRGQITESNPAWLVDLSNYRILAAEDNQINQRFLLRVLKQTGAHVTLVNDGDAAIKSFRDQAWDLLLMDVRLPNIDGLSAIKTIRQIEQDRLATRPVPVIVLSAFAGEENKSRSQAVGADHFIAKPFKPKELLDILKTLPRNP